MTIEPKARKGKAYELLVSHLQSENEIFWTRTEVFLVAHAALLGLLANQLPTETVDKVTWQKLLVVATASMAGLVLSLIWKRAIASGEKWLDRWTAMLKEWESEAVGLEIFRASREGIPSSRKTAESAQLLFTIIWSLTLLYLAVYGISKVCGQCHSN
jgi:hypothetical protein